ncbi:hypothetical protein CS542_02070 [Pedobacter sp. IW39]|nr:hypothetical protein CS542_02070 [Pedobacter sp. IW39]
MLLLHLFTLKSFARDYRARKITDATGPLPGIAVRAEEPPGYQYQCPGQIYTIKAAEILR